VLVGVWLAVAVVVARGHLRLTGEQPSFSTTNAGALS
jgi:hypothetical protein